MTELFIPSKESLDLKELGIGPFITYACGFYYTLNGKDYKFATASQFDNIDETYDIGSNFYMVAPIYGQSFKFFRDEHKLDSFCRTTESSGRSYWKISKLYDDGKIKGYSGFTNTYEEAQLECLRQLIKLCKKN